MNEIGIRREDKSRWERRVPLTPQTLTTLQSRHDLRFRIQPSEIRVFSDDEYRSAGVTVSEDLQTASVILAVKEIPTELLQPGKVYVYFSHVIKGQTYNMPMLRRLLELGCSLVDYERIADENDRRLIFFSLHAGYAGMIETLWSLGRRLEALGVDTPLAEIKQAYEYPSLADAKTHLRRLGERIAAEGLPGSLQPLVIGLAGYGNVSRGCQDILSCLPIRAVTVPDLPAAASRTGSSEILQVVFKEEDMVEPIEAHTRFELQDYYKNPEKYRGTFARHLPHLDVLVNTIYWDEMYPRLVTREWARENYGDGRQARLKVIGDISCDIAGSVELTTEATQPDRSCYIYDPRRDEIEYGVEGEGPVVMAVDNLPCELPRESSEHFSATLEDMVPNLAAVDWQADFESLELPEHLKKAVIVHKGQLTPSYRYLQQHLNA